MDIAICKADSRRIASISAERASAIRTSESAKTCVSLSHTVCYICDLPASCFCIVYLKICEKIYIYSEENKIHNELLRCVLCTFRLFDVYALPSRRIYAHIIDGAAFESGDSFKYESFTRFFC